MWKRCLEKGAKYENTSSPLQITARLAILVMLCSYLSRFTPTPECIFTPSGTQDHHGELRYEGSRRARNSRSFSGHIAAAAAAATTAVRTAAFFCLPRWQTDCLGGAQYRTSNLHARQIETERQPPPSWGAAQPQPSWRFVGQARLAGVERKGRGEAAFDYQP